MSVMNESYDVLISGFGPSGAVAANLLGKLGVSTLCVDKAREVYDKPRAIALDHEIMRIFQDLGLAERIAPFVDVFPPSEYYGTQGQLIKRIATVDKPYPMGYTPTMTFTQPPVEQALRDQAASYDCVSLALGTELIGFEDMGEAVTARLRDDAGQTRTVTAKYLIAADGASSFVRTTLGIALEDLVFDEPWVVVDVMVNDSGLAKLPKVAIQYCEPKRPCTYIVGPGRHRRWEIMLSPGEDPAQMREDDSVWQLLSRWLTPEDGTLWRAASYRFHALVASEWRRGRVFIAGDAAHQQPPFIGQGMCQGVRDIVNLVWKLERVLRGKASDALLDTYQVERKQHVTTLTTRIKEIGRVICERDEAAATARDARLLAECGGVVKTVTRQEIVPPLQSGLLAADGNAMNGTLFPQPLVATTANASALLDDVVGGGWRVVVDDVALLDSGWVAAARDIGARVVVLGSAASLPAGSVAVQEKEGVLARGFETHDCHAAIVRPDHYVWGVAGHAGALATQLDALIGALR